MTENIIKIKNLTLIGTAHVSEDSVHEVKETIDLAQPKIVCIELDSQRYESMINQNKWEDTDIVSVIRQKKLAGLLIQIVLSSFQKKMSTSTESGAELKQAIQSANESHAQIELIDRDIRVTLNRIWRKISFWEKASLIGSGLTSSEELDDKTTDEQIKKLMENDIMETVFSDMKKQLPIVHQVIISERDEFMANNLREIMSATNETIVAVVGKGHVPGITKILEDNIPTTENKRLNIIPKKKISSRIAEFAFPTALVATIIASFFVGSGFDQLTTWMLWNSSLAALFTLLSGGHFLSVLTAFVTAPIGTLNPVLSVGFFVAIVEATIRKPRVKDLKHVVDDMASVKTFMKNRVLRIILVFFTSSLGGAIGNIIGGTQLIRHLLG